MRRELFLANLSPDAFVSAVHRAGTIVTDVGPLEISAALFDSGALSASYICAAFFEKNRAQLEPYARPVRGFVKLAAKKSVVPISQCLLLSVVFRDSAGKHHSARIEFFVLPDSNNIMVVGLPAIVMHFSSLFMDMLRSAVDEYSGEPSHDLTYIGDDLLEPWSAPHDIDAPEDAVTDHPCIFTDVLNFLEVTPEEARKEYFDQMDTHVSEAFRTATPVLDLLRSDKGVRAFVPTNWEGIKNIPLLEFDFKDSLPERLRFKARPVNPKLYGSVEKEVQRLIATGYFKPSRSPIACCMVVAPKATAPFFRICVDYRPVNVHVKVGHYPIPFVQLCLEKIAKFKVFLDLDWVNAFHQVRLGPRTSEILSVVTPWGQFAPQFMPEGVAPASFILQEVTRKIFGDFDEWTIAVFDNLLVLADSFEDAYAKLEIIIDRCNEYNVYLKFAKTWLGFDKVLFFGYECSHQFYTLADERKKAVLAFNPPKTAKLLMSFLGFALYFKSFVEHYATLAAPLYEMTKADFPWDGTEWTPQRVDAFRTFQTALSNCVGLFYPDYEKDFVLRCDASLEGVGMVLYQVHRETPDSEPVHQVIMFASQKFSDQARRWATIEQEAYAVFWAVKTCEFYLRFKPFVLETDHANLQWMEASLVAKIIRWRIYLQGFTFMLRHIPGKNNVIADWLSRNHPDPAIAAGDVPAAQDPGVLAQFLAVLAYDPNEKLPDLTVPPAPAARSPRKQLQHREEQQQDRPDDHTAEQLDIATVPPVTQQDIPPAAPAAAPAPSWESLLKQVHGGRMGHNGARRTWKLLNELFPGHRIPYRLVEEFVSSCAICQKDRLGMTDAIQPVYRTLQSGQKRRMVGVDTLTVTPADKYGNCYVIVIVVHATKLVFLHPAQNKTAEETALALFRFFAQYGVYEYLISDPGSDLMSEVVAHLVKWLGMKHIFSLVDRHESNGVEGSNKSILRHLNALVADERVADRWSHPSVLLLVQFLLNSQVSNETGLSPFHAHFGTEDNTYFRLPETADTASTAQAFVKLLDNDLRTLWTASRAHQDSLLIKRGANADPALQNQYQPGDLVLFHRAPDARPLPSKLTLRFAGPYEVIVQNKNDVQCRHLCVKTVHTFHVERLKIFTGGREEAERVALLDHDQYQVDSILYYRGNPEIRTTMEFFIRYADGEERWVTWTKDLFDTVQYEEFCRAHAPLFPLLFTTKDAQRRISEIKNSDITEVAPGDTVYVDLRSRGGATWYNSIGLPDSARLTYVLPCVYTRWVHKNKLRKILLRSDVTKEEFPVDHYFVRTYGMCRAVTPASMVVIDAALCTKYPLILPQ
jgi:hypothetical protein